MKGLLGGGIIGRVGTLALMRFFSEEKESVLPINQLEDKSEASH